MPSLCVLSAKLPQTLLNYYRPQTKFAKVMFLQLSVSHSVHSRGFQAHTRGGGVGGLGRGVSRPTPRGVSRPTPGGVSWPRPGGVWISTCCDPPPHSAHGYCCRRYASYWNAFLFNRVFHNTHLIR